MFKKLLCPCVFKPVLTALKYLLGALVIIMFVVHYPSVYDKYTFRKKVGSQVVMITNAERNSGGTGFFVKAPSGKTYIMTNYHVCQLRNAENMVYITTLGSTRAVPKRVIEMYTDHDLCLVDTLDGFSGLEVGKEPADGDFIAIVGHPKLFPLTISKGQYIGKQKISVAYQKEGYANKNSKYFPVIVSKETNEEGNEDFDPLIEIKTYTADQLIAYSRGGNSGSPVVNAFGQVVSVLFAGNQNDNFESYSVPVINITNMLQGY